MAARATSREIPVFVSATAMEFAPLMGFGQTLPTLRLPMGS
jgi:hypothetical protein